MESLELTARKYWGGKDSATFISTLCIGARTATRAVSAGSSAAVGGGVPPDLSEPAIGIASPGFAPEL